MTQSKCVVNFKAPRSNPIRSPITIGDRRLLGKNFIKCSKVQPQAQMKGDNVEIRYHLNYQQDSLMEPIIVHYTSKPTMEVT